MNLRMCNGFVMQGSQTMGRARREVETPVR